MNHIENLSIWSGLGTWPDSLRFLIESSKNLNNDIDKLISRKKLKQEKYESKNVEDQNFEKDSLNDQDMLISPTFSYLK